MSAALLRLGVTIVHCVSVSVHVAVCAPADVDEDLRRCSVGTSGVSEDARSHVPVWSARDFMCV